MSQRLSRLVLVAAFMAATPALSQERLSLLERMNLIESQMAALRRNPAPAPAAQPQQNVELLNRMTQLQGELQALRSQVEQLQNENAQLRQMGRDQYVDIDARLQRLEAGGAVAAPAVAATTPVFSDVAPAVDKAAAEAAAYDAAYKALIERGEAAEAARLFQVFLKDYPAGEFAANAWYWLGESYYVTQNYQLALESFQMVLGQFPDSRKAPDAMLKAGYCQIELKQFGEGLGTLNKLITEHAGHPAAEMAINRLRGLSLDQQR